MKRREIVTSRALLMFHSGSYTTLQKEMATSNENYGARK
jgi:hypothetical protein